MDTKNWENFFAGDRIESSPHLLKMKEEMYRQQLASANFVRRTTQQMPQAISAICKEYHNNWIDNLSAASKVEDDATVTIRQILARLFLSALLPKTPNASSATIDPEIIMYHPVENEVDCTAWFGFYRRTIFHQTLFLRRPMTISPPETMSRQFRCLGDQTLSPSRGNRWLPYDKRTPTTKWSRISIREPGRPLENAPFTYDVHWEIANTNVLGLKMDI
jgi:hypothetical protein